MNLMSLFMSVALQDEEARNSLNQLQRQAEQTGQKFRDVGANMAKVGGAVALGVGAIGGAMYTIASDADAANRKIQATLGLTGQEAKAVADQARDVWKTGFTGSMEEAADAVLQVKQQMSQLNDADLSRITQQSMSIAQTFNEDAGQIARGADTMMKVFGISAEEAMDKITVGFQKGLNYSDEFIDSIAEYSIYFDNMNMSADDMLNVMVAGMENGAFQLDKVGDSIKENFLRLSDMGKGEKDAIKELGLNAQQVMDMINQGGDQAGKAYEMVNMAIAGVNDETERNAITVALYGVQAEDVGKKVSSAMMSAGDSIGDTTGKAQALSDTISQSPAQQMAAQWNTLKDSLVPLATTMMELGMQVLPYVTDGIGKLTGFLSNMSPETQKTVVSVGATVGALGGLLLVLSPVIGAVGSIIPLFAGAGAGAGIFGGALAALTGPVGLTIAAIVGIGTAVGIVAKDLSESSIQVDSWKDKVSDSTAKAVGSFMDLSNKATTALNQLNWSGQAVTQEMATNIIGIYDQMGQQVLSEMQSDHAEQLSSMQSHFSNSSALTEQEEAKIIEDMKAKQAEKEKSVSDSQARIAQILNTAKDENRAITEAEQAEINSIQEEMTKNAIVYLTENEREQKVIFENLKNEASKITAIQAAEVVKNSLHQKEEVVKEAQDQYDKTVAEIIKQRDEMGTISAEQAQKLIAEAKLQKDETIKNAEEMHLNVVGEAQKQAEGHIENVNWETGEVLSKWQVFKNDVASNWKEMWNSTDEWWGKTKTSITDSIDGAVKWVGDGIDKIKGFFSNLKLKLPEIELPKLPKFEIKGEFGFNPPTVPTLGINWNAKGGIFDSPTIFNTNRGLQGVGEAGAEAILPLTNDTLWSNIGSPIASVIMEYLNKYNGDGNKQNVYVTIQSPTGDDTTMIRKARKEFEKLSLDLR